MSRYFVGSGTKAISALTPSTGNPTYGLIDLTSESIGETYNYTDEGSLLASKTATDRDLTSIACEGGVSGILRPETADWLFQAALGKVADGKYVLADVNADLPTSLVQVRRGTVDKKYADLTVRSLSISAAAQDYVKFDVDFIGKSEEAGDTATINGVSSFTKPAYRCTKARLYFGNAGAELTPDFDTCPTDGTNGLCIESATVAIDNGVETAPATYCTGLLAGDALMGKRSVTVDMSLPYSAVLETWRASHYASENATDVAILLAFTSADEDENVQIYIPNFHITSLPRNVGGEGVIDVTISGEALSKGSAEPITVTVNHKTEG